MQMIFSISIISHGHKKFIVPLIKDLMALGRADFEVILTLNLPEDIQIDRSSLPFPITLIRNLSQKSFAENHNAAFAISQGKYFVILNPDIRLPQDPFCTLLAQLQQNPDSICAPLIVNGDGTLEDSARNFPTPLFLLKKFIGKVIKATRPNDFVPTENDISAPDWVAGMFIVVPGNIYDSLHGLDDSYRMYYEDVDFCARARFAGYRILLNGHIKVIHEAQRDSHRNLRYLVWHMRSALRFFTSSVFLKIQLDRLLKAS